MQIRFLISKGVILQSRLVAGMTQEFLERFSLFFLRGFVREKKRSYNFSVGFDYFG